MEVRLIDSDAGFASLEEAWEALQASAASTSVFASFDWQHEWWKAYGAGRDLRLVVASDGGAVVGLLPLHVSSERVAGYPVRILRLVGTGGDTSPDDLGPVLAAGREEEVSRALADAVLGLEGWDVLRLGDLDPGTPFPAAMAAAAGRAALACDPGRAERISYVALPATWDAWLATLHRDRRYRVKKIRRDLLAAYPDARFFAWPGGAALEEGIDRLVALHHARWRDAGEPHAFSSSAYVAFHRAVMRACSARDRLRLYALDLDGRTVAMFYMYRFRGALYLMQAGFDPGYAKVRPGLALLGWVIEQAIQERYHALDFLKGDHRYKDELASGERETVALTVFRSRPGAWVFRVRRHVLPRVKSRLLALVGRGRGAPARSAAEA